MLYFCGRKHDVIRTGDETVFALEIENLLSSCAVFPLYDERLGEIITAAIVLSSSSDYNTTAYLSANVNDTSAYCKYVKANDAFTSKVRKHCYYHQLSGYKHPRLIFIFDKLPTNSSGKMLKHKLKDMLKDFTNKKSKL